MKNYRNLLSRRSEYGIHTPEFKELTDLINAYVHAKILAGDEDFAIMETSEMCDLAIDYYYTDSDIKEAFDADVKWFRKWGMSEKADYMEHFLEQVEKEEADG